MMSGGGLDFTTDDELSGSPAPQALRGNPLARNPLMGATKTPLNASGDEMDMEAQSPAVLSPRRYDSTAALLQTLDTVKRPSSGGSSLKSSSAALGSATSPAISLSGGMPDKGMRSAAAVRERMEPLLEFLEEERVLNPAYSLQYRRVLTTADKVEQLETVLDSLPLTGSDVATVMNMVRSLLPAEKNLTLADALAETSSSNKTKTAPLDPKSEKYVRRFLEKRRHLYRERRTTRVTKLLQDFLRSEEMYVKQLDVIWSIAKQMQSLVPAEDFQSVFGDVRGVMTVHESTVSVIRQSVGELSQDPIAQRQFVTDFVLQPLLPYLRSYHAFMSHHFVRVSVIENWFGNGPNAAQLRDILRKHMSAPQPGAVELVDLFSNIVGRMEGYKGLIERLELLLEEERAPLGSERRKKDVETSERIQAVCSELLRECANLQVSIRDSLNYDMVVRVVRRYQLPSALTKDPLRHLLREERVRLKHTPAKSGKTAHYEDALLILFSDSIVLLNVTQTAQQHPVFPMVAHLNLAELDLEDYSSAHWYDDEIEDFPQTSASLPSSSGGATPMAGSSDGSGGGKFPSKVLSVLKRARAQSSQPVAASAAEPGLASVPDAAALAVASSAFGLLESSGDRWLVMCNDRAKRISVVDDISNQKFKHRVFGQSVAFLAERDGDAVPEIVRSCGRELRKRCGEEGVFRIPGRAQFIENVVKSVNSGNKVEVRDLNTHDIAGIFKTWYRQLPQSVIPRPLLPEFTATNSIPEMEKRIAALRDLCQRKLPSHNARVLSFTLATLAPFSQHKATSKMDSDNLATVFAPALFFCLNQPDQTKEEILENARLGPEIKSVVSFLIDHFDEIVEDQSQTLKKTLMEAAGNSGNPSVPSAVSATSGSK